MVCEDPGYGGAQIIEVLTEQVDERYLGYLEEKEIADNLAHFLKKS